MVYYLHRNTKRAVFGCVSSENLCPHINITDKMFIVNCNTSFCLMVVCRKWKLRFSAANCAVNTASKISYETIYILYSSENGQKSLKNKRTTVPN